MIKLKKIDKKPYIVQIHDAIGCKCIMKWTTNCLSHLVLFNN